MAYLNNGHVCLGKMLRFLAVSFFEHITHSEKSVDSWQKIIWRATNNWETPTPNQMTAGGCVSQCSADEWWNQMTHSVSNRIVIACIMLSNIRPFNRLSLTLTFPLDLQPVFLTDFQLLRSKTCPLRLDLHLGWHKSVLWQNVPMNQSRPLTEWPDQECPPPCQCCTHSRWMDQWSVNLGLPQFCVPGHSPLTSHLHRSWHFYDIILSKTSWDCWECKSLEISRSRNTQTMSDTNNPATSKSERSHFLRFLISDVKSNWPDLLPYDQLTG